MKPLLRLFIRFRFVLISLFWLCLDGVFPVLSQNLAGPFDFSAANQLTTNFAITCTSAGTLTVSGGQLAQIGANTAAWVYDTTPDGTPTNTTFSSFCVTAQFTPQAANDSFGFYFYNGSNRTNGSMLVVFNADYSGSDDRISFFGGACMNSSDAGSRNYGTQTLSGGGYTTGKRCQATLVVTPIGSGGAVATMIISDLSGMSLPNFIATQYFTGLGATSGEIGFRSNKRTTGTTHFDNIAVRTPLAITVLETSTTSARISWPAYPGATYYKVYRDGVLQTSTTNLSCVDYGPMDWFKSYEYQVIAYDSNWCVVTASPITVFAYRRFAFVPSWDDASTGTAADLSDWSTQPASQQITISNGHFYAGGQRIRFMGTNMTAQACFPSYNDPLLGNVAEKIAARLSKLGINCVRLIGIDCIVPYGMLNADLTTFDATQLDRLDYFISRLKAHGIYVDIVIHGSRRFPGYDSTGLTDMSAFHAVDLYHPGMIQLQKEYASALLTHTNAYTGNTYANEPAVALLEINNEDGLTFYWRAGLFNTGTTINSAYLTELQTQWNTWLATKYANTASLSAAWAPSAGQSYGASLMTNGDFANGTGTGPYLNTLVNGSRWYFQVQSTSTQSVTATSVLINGGSPDGAKRALKVSVTQACPAAAWRSQLLYTPVDGTSVSPIQYTTKFWAKADAARTIYVGIQQNHPPYGSLGGTNVSLTTEWRQYTLVIPVTATDSNAVFVVGNLAAQTGDIYFADFSLVTGNTPLGGREAWAEGSLGSEILANGTFSATGSPWQLQYANPPLATLSIVQDSQVGSAAQIDITSTSTLSYLVGLLQSNRTCTNGQPYTLTFQAKASTARSMNVSLGQGYGSYYCYAYSNVNLTTSWQTYTVILAPNMSVAGLSSDSQTQFSFGGLATMTGQVWIANVSLKQGVMSIGLPSSETLGTATMLQPDTLMQRSRAAQKDWLKFLWETEKKYWSTMKTYIKTTLGAKGLIIGTQTNFSQVLLQADMDVVDVHSYWQHPSSVSDAENWYVKNIPMAGDVSGGAFSPAALTRVPGKPFVCTEYNTPSPITYGGETLLLAAAYAGMHDWDGLFIFGYEHGALPSQQYFTTYFQIAQEPVKQITLPISASIMRKGAVATTSNVVTASVTPDQAISMSARSNWPGAGDFGIPAKAALIYATGIQSTSTYCQVVAPYIPSTATELVSTTNEMMWDTNDKLVTVNTAKAKVFTGKSNNQSFDFGDGVVVTPGASMQAGNWCAISLMAKDGANFSSAGKVLITATGYTDNHGMLWKTGMGPLDATSSIGSNWGKAPVLTEGIDATIVLPAAYDKVTVWALDPRGQHLMQVPVTSSSGHASFTLSRSNLTVWYEAVIAP